MTTRKMRTPSISVVVVDDQAIVRGGVRMILDAQDDIEVVGEAGNGQEGVEMSCELDPDVILMDIRMPVLDGIAATRVLQQRGVRGRVLMLTTYAVDDNVYEALRVGASGFFAKTDDPDRIVAAVRAAANGDITLGPGAMQLVLDNYVRQGRKQLVPPDELARLTERERQILLLVGMGRTNVEIARELIIGEETVKTHVARLTSKLNLRDRIHAVVYCHEHHLLPIDS